VVSSFTIFELLPLALRVFWVRLGPARSILWMSMMTRKDWATYLIGIFCNDIFLLQIVCTTVFERICPEGIFSNSVFARMREFELALGCFSKMAMRRHEIPQAMSPRMQDFKIQEGCLVISAARQSSVQQFVEALAQ